MKKESGFNIGSQHSKGDIINIGGTYSEEQVIGFAEYWLSYAIRKFLMGTDCKCDRQLLQEYLKQQS